MNNHYVANSDNEKANTKRKNTYEVDRRKNNKLTGAHDRPAIFIENNNDDDNDSTTLLINQLLRNIK